VRAMNAIRRFIPDATLVQTEDIGRTFATAPLSRQADHDTRRSWLSLDLLFGRVGPGHAFYRRLCNAGISAAQLAEFEQGTARPDLIGINHYLTSDRFLDHRTKRYPHERVGGNGRQRYVDVEAVRVPHLVDEVGIKRRIEEVWERYQAPMAITEVHHGCTHDEQLRWLTEVWTCANEAAASGIDLRAVTLWSMFGNVDWRSLLTRNDGHYDPGMFDVRSTPPRPTVLAKAARAMAAGAAFEHPVLASPGWWHRPDRFYGEHDAQPEPDGQGAPLMIVGATGTLGRGLARVARHRGIAVRVTSRRHLELGNPATIRAAIEQIRPWAIINAAGFVRVADAERDREGCFAANAGGVEHLARAAAEFDLPLVGISSDLVFDGAKGAYTETDPCNPCSVYGESKLVAEGALLAAGANNLVVRTAAFFGPWDFHNFAWHTLQALKRGERIEARADVRVSPTYVPDLCHAILDLLIDGEKGIWHLANAGSLSWHEFAARLAEEAGIDARGLVATSGEASDTSLISEHGAMLRPVEAAIHDYCRSLAGIEQDFVDGGASAQA
jgi:dTDP-4-dehydrorhamnose reductase